MLEIQFYPPTLMSSFMDSYPPTKLDMSLYDSGNIGYFQNYRNETLSKFSMLPYEWGIQKTPYTPRPDIVADTMRRKINRELTVLPHDISAINPIHMKEVDDLFKIVQIHRSQYKDRTGSFYPSVFFKPDSYMYQNALGMTESHVSKYPTSYVKYKIPIILPLTYERRKQTPYIPDFSLSGIYNKSSCIAYKR
ncbi:hypothetical protein WN51_06543 [Melipona quadrifasciata]|uniref:Uncharacterized protein n=1 Tax=Melipona quadrifasciata TaxID=166423 RepID=A0A0M8ZTW5_9HYME|nr:hypothetical protein WN51_06543 [Melipona quadrifasciata]